MFERYADWEYTCAASQLVAFMLAMGAKLVPGQFLHVFRKPRSFMVDKTSCSTSLGWQYR